MQKLLRRSPPAAGPILLSATPPANFPFSLKLSPKLQTKFISVTSSCTITTGDNFSSYFSSSTKGSSLFVEPHAVQRMPTAAAALKLRPCVGVDVNSLFSSKPTFSARLSSGGSCRVCRCSIDNGVNPHRRWVAFKGVRNGSRLAWVHTTANGDGSVSAVEGFNMTDKDDADVEQQGESNTEEKPVKLQRRQRGSRGGVLGLPANPDLLTIPGVGPRNLRKLVDKGIAGVDQLKQLYRDKFLGQSNEKMVEYLRSSVGIVHINHAESITTYIKESVDEDLKDGSDSGVKPQKKRLTFCVEGNISVGKTTFLQRIANETLELQDLVEIVPEPIDKWQNVGPDHFNILDAFYAEPQRYAYTFQNYVFVTRLMQERESSAGMKPLRLMERSVFSDRMVFVRAVHEAKWMNEMEISIYDSWFDPVVSSLPGLIPDGFIYLRASPDTCHKRMMLRRRAEEGGVSLDYLRDLHEKHESWLLPFQSGNHGVFSVSEVPFSMDSSLHPDIRDRVLYLEGSHMHSSIQKVPALVLDCEPDIDFNKDIDAKQHYARQVAEFFEFVKRKKDDAPLKAGEKAGKSGQQQVVLPSQGGLWAPGGKRFSELEFNSLNLDRVMYFLSR